MSDLPPLPKLAAACALGVAAPYLIRLWVAVGTGADPFPWSWIFGVWS
jgi:hypothetical protein